VFSRLDYCNSKLGRARSSATHAVAGPMLPFSSNSLFFLSLSRRQKTCVYVRAYYRDSITSLYSLDLVSCAILFYSVSSVDLNNFKKDWDQFGDWLWNIASSWSHSLFIQPSNWLQKLFGPCTPSNGQRLVTITGRLKMTHCMRGIVFCKRQSVSYRLIYFDWSHRTDYTYLSL